jgi:hypothetical protein
MADRKARALRNAKVPASTRSAARATAQRKRRPVTPGRPSVRKATQSAPRAAKTGRELLTQQRMKKTFFVCFALLFVVFLRVGYLQVVKADHYQQASLDQRLRKQHN